jgi:hypothetical protein
MPWRLMSIASCSRGGHLLVGGSYTPETPSLPNGVGGVERVILSFGAFEKVKLYKAPYYLSEGAGVERSSAHDKQRPLSFSGGLELLTLNGFANTGPTRLQTSIPRPDPLKGSPTPEQRDANWFGCRCGLPRSLVCSLLGIFARRMQTHSA